MTDPPLSTMAPSEAAAPPTINQTPSTALPATPARPVTKILVTREHDLTIRAFFPLPQAPMKFNPTSAMNHLLRTMLKDEPSLVLRTAGNDKQIVLASEPLPTGEKAFTQFFNVSTPRAERQNTTHVCIGCHVLSNRTLGNIKFHSPEQQLLKWLKTAKVFVESDSLGTERPVTVGYFTKIDPTITHLPNLQEHLINQLLLIELDADTAVNLAPHLKKQQLDAMSNGDDFVPILPSFALYKTRLTHGREPSQISTEVVGVKGAPRDAKLLGEFFTRLASEVSNDVHDGVFIPKGAAHLLGPATYAQVIKENNFFLNQVATIPVNLEYSAWFAIIDNVNHSANEPVTLYDHLLRQPWFLRVEAVTRTKCIVVTTKSNLPEAREWIDNNLEAIIRKSIPSGVDPSLAQLPRRLDKPVYTSTSRTYAEILKQQYSLATNPQLESSDNNRPPRKRQATSLLDYNLDPSTAYPPLVNNIATTTMAVSNHTVASTTATPAPSIDYAKEIESLKAEILSLRNIITEAVEQLKRAAASFPTTSTASPHATSTSNAMETDVNNQIDIPALIIDLKKDIAHVLQETKTMFNAPLASMMHLDNLSSIT